MNIMILIESIQELEKLAGIAQNNSRFHNIALYQKIHAEDSNFIDNYKE